MLLRCYSCSTLLLPLVLVHSQHTRVSPCTTVPHFAAYGAPHQTRMPSAVLRLRGGAHMLGAAFPSSMEGWKDHSGGGGMHAELAEGEHIARCPSCTLVIEVMTTRQVSRARRLRRSRRRRRRWSLSEQVCVLRVV